MSGVDEHHSRLSPAEVSLVRGVIGILDVSHVATAAIGRAVGDATAENAPIAVLTTLAAAGTARPTTLRSAAGLSSPGIAHLLDRLESEGLVARTPRGDLDGDRRAVVVSLTDHGARVESAIVRAVGDSLRNESATIKGVIAELRRAGARPVPRDDVTGSSSNRRTAQRLASIGVGLGVALQGTAQPLGRTARLALIIVAEAGHCRPVHLADLLGLSTGGVTKLLDRIEDAGLVVRTAGDPTDGRSVFVQLTDDGLREVRSTLHRLAGPLDHVLRELVDIDDEVTPLADP
jgi:DNA-binding MarR family transcriptional regulator